MALAIDASSPVQATKTATGTTVTTASFTAPANSLLVAYVPYDTTDAATANNHTVTDSGALTWTLVGRKSPSATSTGGAGRAAGVEIWSAPQVTSAARTVTATQASAKNAALVVKVWTDGGSLPTVGAVAAASALSGLPSVAVTTTAANSWVSAVSSDWTQAGLGTAGTAQTITDEYNSAGFVTTHVWRQNAVTAASATAVTMNLTAPGLQEYNVLAVEVKAGSAATPSGTGTGSTTWTGTAAGQRDTSGTGVGSTPWVGSAAGSTVKSGTTTGATPWTGSATGSMPTAGAATGDTTWVGSAAGSASPSGTSVGDTTWTGSAAGPVSGNAGTALGDTTWAGSASGTTSTSGTSVGSTPWVGSAAGSTSLTGTAVGSTTWTGSAAGTTPVVAAATGTAVGSTVWLGSSAGSRVSSATVTGSTTWVGTAITVAVVYLFTPPSRLAYRSRGAIGGWGRQADVIGRTVLKVGASYTTVDNPTDADIAAATIAYGGGRTYTITAAESIALTAAGYGANVTA